MTGIDSNEQNFRRDPLDISIEGGKLTITIGMRTLAVLIESSSLFESGTRIVDEMLFGDELIAILRADGDDGRPAVVEMLEQAAEKAAEEGAQGIFVPGDNDHAAHSAIDRGAGDDI